jgi:hypothetical protein
MKADLSFIQDKLYSMAIMGKTKTEIRKTLSLTEDEYAAALKSLPIRNRVFTEIETKCGEVKEMEARMFELAEKIGKRKATHEESREYEALKTDVENFWKKKENRIEFN